MPVIDKKRSVRIDISGKVQGVGFRPFIYNLARKLNMAGYVANTNGGVRIEITGTDQTVNAFIESVHENKPPLSQIDKLSVDESPPTDYDSFRILGSLHSSAGITSILPDIATCPDCMNDINDPDNRRYRYPFTNCTNCGPRYSIILDLPYDRENTTMKRFEMCPECRAEYTNPSDRRFHAQPIACPVCGPHLELLDSEGGIISSYDDAISETASLLSQGKIIALKGLGGFQLLVNACDEKAVTLLRDRKKRNRKPLAVMVRNIDQLKRTCDPSDEELELLQSFVSPIVLVKFGKSKSKVASNIAPNNSSLGVMLPYTPLHHLLMNELDFPVVCTSGNISDEPIITDEQEAVQRLSGIADYFLVHNRPIARPVDDSVVRIIADKPSVIRSARGYAPLEFDIEKGGDNIIAAGAHLKNTVAITSKNKCIISQHIGDLSTKRSYNNYQDTIKSLGRLYRVNPDLVVSDKHPDYLSTCYAHSLGKPVVPVQHHYAHLLSCLLENRLTQPVMGVVWDGTGLGDDGTIWGGEFLVFRNDEFKRAGFLRQFRLPGGEAAILEPRRSALALLYEMYGKDAATMERSDLPKAFTENELTNLIGMLERKVNCPVTSSMGRLFDGVSSLMGLCQISDYEAEAAIALESAIEDSSNGDCYDFKIDSIDTAFVIDWHPLIADLIKDLRDKLSLNIIASRFHNTLAEIIVTVAEKIGIEQVVLTGGCFQNKYLTEKAMTRLQQEHFRTYRHQLIPANDGGISAGQIAAGLHKTRGQKNVPGNSR